MPAVPVPVVPLVPVPVVPPLPLLAPPVPGVADVAADPPHAMANIPSAMDAVAHNPAFRDRQ
jgi:hypothetical protein